MLKDNMFDSYVGGVNLQGQKVYKIKTTHHAYNSAAYKIKKIKKI